MRIALALVLATGCGIDARAPEEPLARTNLLPLLGGPDVVPVGVAIAPDGKRFVLDEQRGLYRLDGDHATSIVSMSSMYPSDVPLELPVTDIVALGPDLFAVTALNDGFLLDTQAQTLTQHFCYLPGDDGSTPRVISQRTDALAYDAAAGRLWAQPRTFDAVGELQLSQVAQYDRTTGQDLQWYVMARDIHATAAVVMPDGVLVLGQGPHLLAFDPATDRPARLDDLSRYGVRSIDGLAFDALSGVLVVADGTTDEVVDLDVSQLSL